MTSEQARATWQSEPCPPWCAVVHRDDDHPDDRYHDSAVVQVPAIVLERDREAGPGRWITEPADITIVTSRHADTSDMVTLIGRDGRLDQQLSLTPEGAGRLAAAIVQHLASLDRRR